MTPTKWVLCFMLLGYGILLAQTPVSGTIDGTTTWTKNQSPYIVTGALLVSSSGTLNIEAGVSVSYNGDHPFVVNGRLRIRGVLGDSVRFSGVLGDSVRVTGGGLQLKNGSNTSIKYAVIEGFEIGLWAFYGSVIETVQFVSVRKNRIGINSESPFVGGNISGEGNFIGIQFNNSVISERKVVGVRFERNSVGIECRNSSGAVRITDGTLKYNQAGISVREGNFVGQNLHIQHNDTGVYVRYGAMVLRSSTVSNNSVCGADIYQGAAEFIDDTIEYNPVGILSKGVTTITSCTVRYNTLSGMSLGLSEQCTYSTISHNGAVGISSGGTSSVQFCIIQDNDSIGISLTDGSPSLKNSSITRNGSYGVMERGALTPTFRNNNIWDNARYDLIMTSQVTGEFNAADNYWGTTVPAEILGKIFDQADSPQLMSVKFSPYGITQYSISENSLPVLKLSRTNVVTKDTVSFTYLLSDAEKNILSLDGEYRNSLGQWLPMTILGKSSGISSNEYMGNIRWISGADLSKKTGPFLVRWRASDQFGFGPWDTLTVLVQNNSRSVGAVTSVTGTIRASGAYRDTIFFSVTVSDAEQDSSSLKVFYRFDSAGTVWKRGTTVGNSGQRPPGMRTVGWNTVADIAASPGLYFVRVVPYDFIDGLSDTMQVKVDNYGVVTLTISFNPVEEASGNILMPFNIRQYDPHSVTLAGQFSTDEGNLWLPATINRQSTVSNSIEFNDTIIWHSGIDLPGTDRSNVWFRLWPYNPLSGVPSVARGIHIDNNTPPKADSVRVFAYRVSGDVAVVMPVKDADNDIYTILCEYTTDNSQTWVTATISNVSAAVDSCRWIWKSGADMYNKDRIVRLRARASDNDPGNIVYSAPFRIDNVKGPKLLSSSVPVIHTDDSIRLTFDSPLRFSTISTGIKVSSSRDSSIPVTVLLDPSGERVSLFTPSRFAAADTISIHISADTAGGLRDTAGNCYDGNRNEELEGSPIDDTKLMFRTSLLGDYTLDGEVNISDLALFRSYWSGKFIRYELGPAKGTPPFMRTMDDGLMDIEDLMVFIQNWNWSAQRRIPSIQRPVDELGSGSMLVRLIQENRADHRFVVTAASPEATSALECIIQYSPEQVKLSSANPHELFSAAVQRHLTLTYHDSIKGVLILSFAQINGTEFINDGMMASVEFQPKIEGSISVSVLSTIVASDGSVYRGMQIVKTNDLPSLPNTYGMEQNFPNPFNPLTTIRYQIPENGRVKIKVFNMVGQQIATVLDDWREAGFYSVNFNGSAIPSGVYFYRISVNEYTTVRRMVLLK